MDTVETEKSEKDEQPTMLITRMCGFCKQDVPENYMGDHQAVSCPASPMAKQYLEGRLPADPTPQQVAGGMVDATTRQPIDWGNAPPGTLARPATGGVAVKKRWTRSDMERIYPAVTVIPPYDFVGNHAITFQRVTYELKGGQSHTVPSIIADIMFDSIRSGEDHWVDNSDGRTPGKQSTDVPGLHRFNTTGPVRD
jgi:hypothetical protein